MLEKITRAIHSFKRGVRNLIAWFPIIWRDRDWDYHYLLEMLAFKLRRISKSTKYWNTMNADNVGKQTLLAAHYIDGILEEKRRFDAHAKHEEKWGKMIMLSTPLPDKPKWSELHITHPKANTPELKEQEAQEFRELMTEARKLELEDIERLLGILRGFERWWD